MYEAWVDGSCRPQKIKRNKYKNIGISGIGVVIKKDGQIVHEHSSYIGENFNNNQVEYEALIYAIDKMIEYDARSVTFYTDSNAVEKTMNDKYNVYAESMIPHFMKAKKLIQMLPEWRIKLIRREDNRHADKLAVRSVKAMLKQLEE